MLTHFKGYNTIFQHVIQLLNWLYLAASLSISFTSLVFEAYQPLLVLYIEY